MSLFVLLANMYEHVEKNYDELQKNITKQNISLCSDFYIHVAQHDQFPDKELKYVTLWEKYIKCFPEGSDNVIIYSMFMNSIGMMWYDSPMNFVDHIDQLLIGLDDHDAIDALNGQYNEEYKYNNLHKCDEKTRETIQYEASITWYNSTFSDCRIVTLVTYCIKIRDILMQKNINVNMLDDLYDTLIEMFIRNPDDCEDLKCIPTCILEEKKLESEFIDVYMKIMNLHPGVTKCKVVQILIAEKNKDEITFYENLSNGKLLEIVESVDL